MSCTCRHPWPLCMTTHVGGRIFTPSAMYTSSLRFVNVQYALLSILYGFCFQRTCSIALPIWRESLHLYAIRFKFAFFMSHLKGVKGHQSLRILKNCKFYQRGVYGGYFKERGSSKTLNRRKDQMSVPQTRGGHINPRYMYQVFALFMHQWYKEDFSIYQSMRLNCTNFNTFKLKLCPVLLQEDYVITM